ncbi:hypothetical protein [Pelomonas sp. Root1237]|uniref:hypothetical protein n=1 Tax=Pelomonas sp. Root1237 TaxID=1736434 RepID=UPI0006F3748D|nr:hypothetical protein [Pelomonas sp. Root1237]KQV88045.1 hypothetical protein ASC91_14385 [Pelomonas sp. Root1237]
MNREAGLGLVVALLCAAPVLAAGQKKPTPVAKATPAVAAASAPAPALSEAQRDYIEQIFKNLVVPRFTVRADDALDDEARAAAQAMQAEHLPRVQALMTQWALEEIQQPEEKDWFRRMTARLANEFALWGRDSTGPEQDAALSQALRMPGMCRPVGGWSSELVMRLARLRGLPPEVRRAAVQAERDLLARWGKARQVDETEPLDAEDMLLALRVDSQPPWKPLPPVLAQLYLGDSGDSRLDPRVAEPAVRCALHQWGGVTPAQFRAAMAMQAADVLGINRLVAAGPTSADNAYPKLGSLFTVRGVITIRAALNSDGKLVNPTVVQREISVPGLREVRALAFEGVLDLATLTKAQEMDWMEWAPKQGMRLFEREFEWDL